ncbi:MAG TPA: LysM domain-containing protein [Chloroflexi bacterium]|mgnify:CR=1 FL=1|nr:LysM domain-containing protein [Chloroflexota bacterium]
MNDLSRLTTEENRSLILAASGALVVLIVLAWGLGWVSHTLIEQGRQIVTPTRSALPPIPLPARPVTEPTDPTLQVQPIPATTPTKPTLSPTSIPQNEITIQSGEGLYQICRRHCAGRWPPDDAALTAYAEEVARLNQLPWPNPLLYPGQRLEMPPCPRRYP